MKDLGDTDVILGMKIIKSLEVTALSNSTEKMIDKFGYYDIKRVPIPYDHSVHVMKNLGESISQLRYPQSVERTFFLISIKATSGLLLEALSHVIKMLEKTFQTLKGSLDREIDNYQEKEAGCRTIEGKLFNASL